MFTINQHITEQKIYRWRRKRRLKYKRVHFHFIKFGKGDVCRHASRVIQFLINQENNSKERNRELQVPRCLGYKQNFSETVSFLIQVVQTFYNVTGNITLDFTRCNSVSVSSLIVLKTVLEELDLFSTKVASSRFRTIKKSIKLIPSKSDIVNRHLHSLRFAKFKVSELEQKEYLVLGLMRGRSRNYRENRKAVVSRKVAQFVENTAERFDVGFDERGQNYIEKMVGEILSNAEDHSLKKSEWFVDGVSYLHEEPGNEVIEFNLVIINYGNSMYEGFELTKQQNHDLYEKLDNLFHKHESLFTLWNKFERESLFVLYMLNEGISRLKYMESSRGNGTMNFIKSFIELGKFCNEDSKYRPELNIISGHTVLTCTDEYAPFLEGTHYKLTLNKVRSLDSLPDSSVLKYFKDISFPGTILDCKIFLNKRDLERNIKERD